MNSAKTHMFRPMIVSVDEGAAGIMTVGRGSVAAVLMVSSIAFPFSAGFGSRSRRGGPIESGLGSDSGLMMVVEMKIYVELSSII